MNMVPLRRTLTLAAITFAGGWASAAPALASTTDGTSNTMMTVRPAPGTTIAHSFQGGCSKGVTVCLMEPEGIHWPA